MVKTYIFKIYFFRQCNEKSPVDTFALLRFLLEEMAKLFIFASPDKGACSYTQRFRYYILL